MCVCVCVCVCIYQVSECVVVCIYVCMYISCMLLHAQHTPDALKRPFERVPVHPFSRKIRPATRNTRQERHNQRMQMELDAAMRGESPPTTATPSASAEQEDSGGFRQHLRSKGLNRCV
jgi:hypothetical protein